MAQHCVQHAADPGRGGDGAPRLGAARRHRRRGGAGPQPLRHQLRPHRFHRPAARAGGDIGAMPGGLWARGRGGPPPGRGGDDQAAGAALRAAGDGRAVGCAPCASRGRRGLGAHLAVAGRRRGHGDDADRLLGQPALGRRAFAVGFERAPLYCAGFAAAARLARPRRGVAGIGLAAGGQLACVDVSRGVDRGRACARAGDRPRRAPDRRDRSLERGLPAAARRDDRAGVGPLLAAVGPDAGAGHRLGLQPPGC